MVPPLGNVGALLAEIATKRTGAPAPTVAAPTTTVPRATPAAPGDSGGVPPAPFSVPVTGFQTTTPNGPGEVRVTLALHLGDAMSTPLTIELEGAAVSGGGVSLTRGSVTFGPYPGRVTSLDGDTVDVALAGDGPLALTVSLSVDQGTGVLSQQVQEMQLERG